MANEITVTEEVEEWIRKAEEDYIGATRLMKQTKPPTYNLVCFCAEQCVEKYLKAYLTAANVRFEYKHQLEKLMLPLCIKVDSSFEMIRDLVRRLDAYSVEFRYPGESADRQDAMKAVHAMKHIREFIRAKLRLEKPSRSAGKKRR